MDLMEKQDRYEVRDLFSKNWLTHDAMWYGICMGELGPEKAKKFFLRDHQAALDINPIGKIIDTGADYRHCSTTFYQ